MDEQRQDVPLADIPADLQHAFVAVEDHRFYRHLGVDPIALGRAVARDIRAAGAVQGGSTLTQQLARTLFLSNKKSYGRKIREAALALLIDSVLSKDQILELYLNRIYLSAGVYGVETMSRHLFGRPAKSLNLAESALIAGLADPPCPLDELPVRSSASTRAAADSGELFITAAQDSARSRASGSGRSRARGIHARLRQGVPAPAFSAQFGAIIPPYWYCARRSCPICDERSVGADGCGFTNATAGALVPSIRTGTSGLVGGRNFLSRSSIARCAPGSSRLRVQAALYAAALENGFLLRRCWTVATPPEGPEDGRRATRGRPPSADRFGRVAVVDQPRRDGGCSSASVPYDPAAGFLHRPRGLRMCPASLGTV